LPWFVKNFQGDADELTGSMWDYDVVRHLAAGPKIKANLTIHINGRNIGPKQKETRFVM
jgi:hypothetical protein